jgi:hypothetical protein
LSHSRESLAIEGIAACSWEPLHYRPRLTLSFTESTTPPITTYPDPNIPFGLDMSFAVPSFNSIDLSFDQTLGLDLAPEYDYSFPIDNGFVENMSLGLDTMGEVELLPRKKKKKVAWVEVSKIIDGK